jgi:hypothetical protein
MSETRPPGFRRATDPAPPGVTYRPPEPSPADALQLPLLPKPGPNAADLEALKDGAAMMIQAGNRVAALALLWSAVALDPIDLASHRRLAATLAHGGDFDAAAEEYARYIEFLLPIGEVGRAALELQYGASTLGGRHALHAAAEKIVAAVREIVPLTDTAIAPPASAFMPAQTALRRAPASAPTVPAADAAPFTAPRLLPKVPFRFCVHADGDRHWMQLEGGTIDLMPVAVRVLDDRENVIETRLCIPLANGDKGHAPVVDPEARSVAWVVVGVPNELVAAIDAGTPWPYGFQTKVGDEWLALDLVDSGCRLGRTRSSTAAV